MTTTTKPLTIRLEEADFRSLKAHAAAQGQSLRALVSAALAPAIAAAHTRQPSNRKNPT